MVTNEIYKFEPDFIVAPGETLQETIETLGITQAELAKRMGRPVKTINGIIKGRVEITPETALQLEKVLGVPARFWVNLEGNYRHALAEQKEKKELKKKIQWLEKFPLKKLIECGYMEKKNDKVEQLQELLKFFGVASIESWEKIWKQNVAFRKSDAYKADPYAIASWVRMIELEAQKIDCKPYNKSLFKANLNEIRKLTLEGEPSVFIPKLREICASSGVAVVFLPELPGCRVSGVTKWLSSEKAVIGLSVRYKSNDHLWFTFFHEAGHILLHGKKLTFLEGVSNESFKEKEIEADTFASNILIPETKYKELKSYGHYSYEIVKTFAQKIGIAPGIVVGRLQHDGLIPFTHLNKLKQYYKWERR